MFGLTADKEYVERLTKNLEGKLAVYDVILGKTKFLAGDVSSFSKALMNFCRAYDRLTGNHPRRPLPPSIRRTLPQAKYRSAGVGQVL